MYADPQLVTISGVTKSLPKIKQGQTDSTFRTADETCQLRISHQTTKARTRRMARLDLTVIAADPLTAINTSQTAGVYFVVDEPRYGFTDAALSALIVGLGNWLVDAENSGKLLGSET